MASRVNMPGATLLAVVLCTGTLGWSASAQDLTDSEPPAATAQEETQPDPSQAVPSQPTSSTPSESEALGIGDVLHLKTGGSVRGQVISRRSGAYAVEIVQGVTINVPVSQVSTIDYDPHTYLEARQIIENARKAKAFDPIASMKLSPQLSSKMNVPISQSSEPLTVPFDNVVGVVEHLGKVCDVKITVGDGVRNLPAEVLKWEGTIPPTTTLYSLFADTIIPKYGAHMTIDFQFDQIVFRLPDAPQGS